MTEPLTPIDLDLRDFGFMPLEVVRLRDSDLAALATGDEFRAAVLLWCAAWHQVPAASLPNDDRLLAKFAGFGRDLKGWNAVRSGALRGFVECTDGRLYHPVIADLAIDAGSKKRGQSSRTQKATEARIRKAEEARNARRDADRDDNRDGQRNEDQGKGQERTGKGEERTGEGADQSDASRPAQADFLDSAPKQRRRKASHSMPDDWKLSDELWTYGTSLGLRGDKLEEEETEIRSWCRQEDHRCVDRDEFVKRWLRRTAKKLGLTKSNSNVSDAYTDFENGVTT